MKRFLIALFLLTCSFGAAAKASMSPLPDDMLPLSAFDFDQGQKFTVYQGPDKSYGVAANGKASVSTNGEIRVFGFDRDYLLIQYGISDERSRIGYIYAGDFEWEKVYSTGDLGAVWTYGRTQATEDTHLTDDPFLSSTPIASVSKGEVLVTLYTMQNYVYVETLSNEPIRGFVPASNICHIPVPYDDDPDLLAAVNMLEETGVEFTVTGRYQNYQDHLYFTLKNGGSIYYLDVFDFYRYDLRSWYEQDISDGDLAKLFDYWLNMAADVQAGNAPEEHLQYGYMDTVGEQNIESVVSNILSSFEGYGQQGLDVLLKQLSAHDSNDTLNSMRSQAASRILGKLDNTPVSPKQGCAWYDALTLSYQDSLPPAAASLYVEDPLHCAATQLLLDYNAEHNPWSSVWVDLDAEKCTNIVSLHIEKVQETSKSTTIWGVEWYSKYALYDHKKAYNVSGHVIPVRIEMAKDQSGVWTLKKVTYAQDGSYYASSILEFCDGNQSLANRLLELPGNGTWQDFATYLASYRYDAELVD